MFVCRPLFDTKILNNDDHSAQSSPPELRAKNLPTSQKMNNVLSRTDSHDSTTSAIATKTTRITKVD